MLFLLLLTLSVVILSSAHNAPGIYSVYVHCITMDTLVHTPYIVSMVIVNVDIIEYGSSYTVD